MNYVAVNHILKTAFELRGTDRWKVLMQHPDIVEYLVTRDHLAPTVTGALYDKRYIALEGMEKNIVDELSGRLATFGIHEVYPEAHARAHYPTYRIMGTTDEQRGVYFANNFGVTLNDLQQDLGLEQ